MSRTPTLLLLLATGGCTPSVLDGVDELLTVTPSLSLSDDVSTVVIADWDLDLDGMTSAWVAFGPTDELGHQVQVDVSASGPFQTVLVGSKGEDKVHVRVFAQGEDGTTYASEESTITTGAVPSALPNLTVSGSRSDHWTGFLVTGLVAREYSVILDEDGDYVWWHEAVGGGGGGGDNGGVALGRTWLARDGQSLYYSFNNVEGDQDNTLHQVSLDGSSDVSIDLPWGHHDFTELPDGTIAYLAYDPRSVSGGEQLGDSIVERTPDGGTTEVWNIWDWYSYSGGGGGPGGGSSWPHCNAIDYLEGQDAYLVGCLTLGAIILVDRQSGAPLWTLGGTDPDISVSGGVDLGSHHQFELIGDDDLLVFDNGGQAMGSSSGVFELSLDPSASSASEIWSYYPSSRLNCTNLGDVERLPSGDTLVTFSVSGEIQEVDDSGELVWELTAATGGALSYTQHVEAIDAWE